MVVLVDVAYAYVILKENALKIQDELKRERIFIMDGYSLGYANIALVKYWGKEV